MCVCRYVCVWGGGGRVVAMDGLEKRGLEVQQEKQSNLKHDDRE